MDILWALGKLQQYLYGTHDINIYTDHQPFTFAVSDRNPSSKIRRWKAINRPCSVYTFAAKRKCFAK